MKWQLPMPFIDVYIDVYYDVKVKSYHGLLRRNTTLASPLPLRSALTWSTGPPALQNIRNPRVLTRLLPHVLAGPKVNYSRLCKHIVKIDLGTLISSYKYTLKQGESSETLPVLINIDLGHLRSQVMIIT